jgi:hypothetical protein
LVIVHADDVSRPVLRHAAREVHSSSRGIAANWAMVKAPSNSP